MYFISAGKGPIDNPRFCVIFTFKTFVADSSEHAHCVRYVACIRRNCKLGNAISTRLSQPFNWVCGQQRPFSTYTNNRRVLVADENKISEHAWNERQPVWNLSVWKNVAPCFQGQRVYEHVILDPYILLVVWFFLNTLIFKRQRTTFTGDKTQSHGQDTQGHTLK